MCVCVQRESIDALFLYISCRVVERALALSPRVIRVSPCSPLQQQEQRMAYINKYKIYMRYTTPNPSTQYASAAATL